MIKLPKKIKVKKNGFSLVELIIATGMAALIMMGMSVFFSGTLKNTFSAQKQVTENQSQFVTGVIVREKFLELQSVLNNFTVNQSYIVALNKTKANQLPFTYIGTANVGGKTRLVFKDAFAFGEVASIGISQQCGNPGSGTILNCASNASTVNGIPKNFAGFTKKGNDYYIAIPDQNKILTCVGGGGTYCTPGNSIISDDTLNQPMDVETDGTNLFISDAGNGRVVQVDGSGTMTVLAKNLKFPTGLAYYKKKDSGHEFLFVADSFDNKIKKIDLGNIDEDTEPEVIVGMGSETACQGSAKYCALNFPTGLFVINVPNLINPQGSQIDLYIADSGNNRILKVKDPGKPDTMTFKFKTGATNEPLKKIVLSFPEGIDASQAKLDSIESSSNTLNLEGEWVASAHSLEYQLFTKLTEDTLITNACKAPCVPTKNKIRVMNPLLFNSTFKKIRISTDADNDFIVNKKEGGGEIITLNNNMANHHNAGEEVTLKNDVDANIEITLSVSELDTTNSKKTYPLIEIKGYGPEGTVLFTAYRSLRIGDDVLGTADDVIEINASNEPDPYVIFNGVKTKLAKPLLFPTSASNANIMNAGKQIRVKESDLTEKNISIYGNITGDEVPFDYVSDFTLDENGLQFKKWNNDTLLEMTLKTKTEEGAAQTTKINAKINQ